MNSEFSTICSYLRHNISHKTCLDQNSITTSALPTLVDFDANLFHKDLDMNTAVTRAKERGVEHFVVPGSTLTDSAQAVAAAEQFDYVLAATAGVHPYNAGSIDLSQENIYTLRHLLSSPHCSAVGECGLDFSDGFPEPSLQEAWFKVQLILALEFNKPLYLHIRKAHDFLVKIFENETIESMTTSCPIVCNIDSKYGKLTVKDYIRNIEGPRVVVHCFTGSLPELEYYVDMGCYIGLTGHLLSLSKEDASQLLSAIPLSRLVLETDAPYMGFKSCRESEEKGRSRKYPNVPASLPKVAEVVADIMKVSYEDICLRTTRNSFSFFSVNRTRNFTHTSL